MCSQSASIKWKFRWTQVKQYAFVEHNRIMARDTLLTYPDFNEVLKIHANASAFQLGSFIIQKDRPIALFILKLTDSQQRYMLI